MKQFLLQLLASLGIFACTALAAERPPNIIFILADDLGIDGVSCYGADKHKTPNIDKLAASGTRFETCYAAPVCGPSRCLLMTGRYAFRTGGLGNQSWRAGGPGAKSADEKPIASILRKAGYATGMAGKWRQVGETPRDWGFDEYTTDPTASGWFWQTKHLQNGQEITKPEGTYAVNAGRARRRDRRVDAGPSRRCRHPCPAPSAVESIFQRKMAAFQPIELPS